MSGRVRQGEYLRLERIAEDLGTSATPVREALLALRGEGFVELEPRRGFLVAPLSRDDVEDLFCVQATIAAELAARAVKGVTPEHVAELDRVHTEFTAAAREGDVERVDEFEARFHGTINGWAGSRKLAWMLDTAARYMPRRFHASVSEWRQAAVRDHGLVLAAVRAGDAERARDAMYRHILHTGRSLLSHLDELGIWSTTGAEGRRDA